MSKKELDHLYLTKNERLGIILLFVLLLILIILPWLYFKSDPLQLKLDDTKFILNRKSTEKPDDSTVSTFFRSFESVHNFKTSKKEVSFELFNFDPNHLQASDAKRLGIPDKSYHILQKYLATGAKIKSAQQLHKIYGIDEKTFNRLEPYIQIKAEDKPQLFTKKEAKKTAVIVNINTAEISDLIPLRGIGEKLATRIIKYRNLLGGFTNESQLHEIYGLQDSTIQKFKNSISINGSVIKLNLNTVEYDELKKHPYVGFQKARVICEYRKQHHLFKGIDDLYKIEAIDSNWIKRISDYLIFN